MREMSTETAIVSAKLLIQASGDSTHEGHRNEDGGKDERDRK